MPSGRRSWCSNGCVHEYLVRSDGSYVRREVFKRDRGVCKVCRVDCTALKKWVGELEPEDRKVVRIVLDVGDRRTFWDADHIVPVSRGGGLCGLEGFRTLCWRCHKGATRAMHRGWIK